MPSSQRSVTELMQQADRLLDSFVELSPGLREQRLRDLAADDSELARMLGRLLLAWDKGGPTGFETGAATRGFASHEELAQGTRFGVFAVQTRLGLGGMGEVYLAQRADGQFVQRVAIKRILSSGSMPPERAAEFLGRERDVLARLQHPGIATLIDGGIDAEGFPWLAMEYIDGLRLDAFLAEHRPGFEQRFGFLLQLIDAVTHAHRQLIVHGDLKPANLMVQVDGRLRVLDFGIARLLSEPASESAGSPATPGWASPEQRAGAAIGIASDQYQIARLALLLLVDNSQPVPDGDGLALRRRAADAGLAHARVLDSTLEFVLSRALSGEPGQRYPDLSALRADLIAWREHRPIAARAGRLRWRVISLLRRHPLSLGLAALLLAASLGFVWTLAARNAALLEARDLAAAEAERATRALDRRSQMLGFVERVFSLADPIGEGGLIQDIDRLLEAAANSVARQFPSDADLRHEARSILGIIALRRSQSALATRLAEASTADTAPTAGSLASVQALALRAELASSAGDYALAAEGYAQALAELGDEHAEAQRWRQFLLIQRLESLRLSGQEAPARALVPQILQLSERSGASAYERSDALSFAALLEPEPQRAYAMQRQAYETLAQVQSPEQPVMIKRLTNLAGTRMLMGDYTGATADYAQALQRVAEAGRLDTEYHAVAQVVYGRLLTLQGRWQEAVPLLERPLAIFGRGGASPLLSYAEGAWLGWAVEAAPSAGLSPRLEAWLSTYRGQVGADHPRIREGQLLQARLLRRQGDWNAAEAALAAIEAFAWKAGAAPDEAEFALRLAAERAGLRLDQNATAAACEGSPFAGGAELEVKLFDMALVSGRAARLDRALCQQWAGQGTTAEVEDARAALVALAGAGHWLLARR